MTQPAEQPPSDAAGRRTGSGKVIPLKKLKSAGHAPFSPWVRGEVCRRDGVDYELVTVGEIQSIESKRGRKVVGQADKNVLDLLSDAGAQVGDLVLVLPKEATRLLASFTLTRSCAP